MLLSTFVLSQDVLKMRTSSFSYKVKNDIGRWTDWSDWESANILVVIDDDRVTIYSKTTQEYDIIQVLDDYVDGDGDHTYPFRAVDQDGDVCKIRL